MYMTSKGRVSNRFAISCRRGHLLQDSDKNFFSF